MTVFDIKEPTPEQLEWIHKEFLHIETLLLYHKYAYYELSKPVIPDQGFDSMEQYAKHLSQFIDPEVIPPGDYVCKDMVGFSSNHRLWPKVKQKFRIK